MIRRLLHNKIVMSVLLSLFEKQWLTEKNNWETVTNGRQDTLLNSFSSLEFLCKSFFSVNVGGKKCDMFTEVMWNCLIDKQHGKRQQVAVLCQLCNQFPSISHLHRPFSDTHKQKHGCGQTHTHTQPSWWWLTSVCENRKLLPVSLLLSEVSPLYICKSAFQLPLIAQAELGKQNRQSNILNLSCYFNT